MTADTSDSGTPPRTGRYKKGQSGNLRGRPKSPLTGIRAILKGALNEAVTLNSGDGKKTVTMAAAGIHQLVRQYAQGDARARKDLFWLADKVDLTAFLIEGQNVTTHVPLPADAKATLDAYVARCNETRDASPPEPVIAPPDLVDDDNTNGGDT